MNRIPKGESLMKSTKIKKRIAPENTRNKITGFWLPFINYYFFFFILKDIYDPIERLLEPRKGWLVMELSLRTLTYSTKDHIYFSFSFFLADHQWNSLDGCSVRWRLFPRILRRAGEPAVGPLCRIPPAHENTFGETVGRRVVPIAYRKADREPVHSYSTKTDEWVGRLIRHSRIKFWWNPPADQTNDIPSDRCSPNARRSPFQSKDQQEEH